MNKKIIWSDYQKAIFDNVVNGKGHTAVIARAGSSKTTTLVESLKKSPKNIKVLVAAFNKSIAEELKSRIPYGIDCLTLHSLGFKAIRKKFGEVVVDDKKVFSILKEIHYEENYELFFEIRKTVSFCKASLIDTPDKISELMDQHGIDFEPLEKDEFIKLVSKTLRLCKEQTNIIDFDDMIYFPFVYKLPVGKYDYIFIDEAQDMNFAQLVLALSAANKNTRIFIFLDDRQAIYDFRGADIRSVNTIIDKLNPIKLPLPITYRCPLKVVNLAQEIVPDLEPAPGAKEGYIEYIDASKMISSVKPGDFVISRTNAPLIKYCLILLKAGIPSNIQGRDIGENLLYFVKKSKAKTVDKLMDYIEKWKNLEIARLTKEKKDISIIVDKADCLYSLCEGAESIKDLKTNIQKLFEDVDDENKVVLSTVHKCKGLERDNVFLLRNTFRRGFNTTEDNIFYVACTRAKDKLYMVETSKNKSKSL